MGGWGLFEKLFKGALGPLDSSSYLVVARFCGRQDGVERAPWGP